MILQNVTLIDIPKYIKDRPELKNNIEKLVDFSIDNNTLFFDKSLNVNLKLLYDYKILKRIGEQLTLEDTELFSYVLYEKYKGHLKPKLGSDFKVFVDFVKKLEISFKGEKTNVGFYRIKNDVITFAILDANTKFNIDFIEYVNSLVSEGKRDDIYSFIQGYSNTLRLLKISKHSFLEICLTLINWTRNDNDHEISSGELTVGIRNKIGNDPGFGQEIFDTVVSTLNFDEDLLIPIITGLYNANGISFYDSKIESIVNDKKFTISIIVGLSNVKEISEKEAILFLSLFQKFDVKNPEILINLPKLLFSILKSKKLRRNSKYKGICFNYLNELITYDNPNLINSIIHEIWLLDGSEEARFLLIIAIIKEPHFKTEIFLGLINNFFSHLKKVTYLETFLQTIAKHHPYQEVYKYMNSSIWEFQKEDKKEFDRIIVKLLVNNSASFRFIGLDIFHNITRNEYSFAYDILLLSPLNQYKLWVSVLGDYREPRSVIPCIIPLINSHSAFVRESVICKLEEYSENFGNEVVEVMKNFKQIEEPEFESVLKRIDEYRSEYFKRNIQNKSRIKELDPQYIHSRLLNEFTINHSRRFNNEVQKKTGGGSFLSSFAATIKLLKGGGWKIEGRDGISKLGKFQTSILLPRLYMTEPELFDYSRRLHLSKNWNDDVFSQVIKAIEDEQQ